MRQEQEALFAEVDRIQQDYWKKDEDKKLEHIRQQSTPRRFAVHTDRINAFLRGCENYFPDEFEMDGRVGPVVSDEEKKMRTVVTAFKKSKEGPVDPKTQRPYIHFVDLTGSQVVATYHFVFDRLSSYAPGDGESRLIYLHSKNMVHSLIKTFSDVSLVPVPGRIRRFFSRAFHKK